MKLSFATFAFAVSQWLLIVYLARAASLEVAGHYSLALAVAAPIYLFAFLGFRTTRAAQGDRPRFGSSLVQIRLVATGVATALSLAVLVPVYWGNSIALLLTGAVIFLKLTESCCDLVYAEKQRTRAFAGMRRSLYIRSFMLVAGTTAGFAMSADPVLVLVVVTLASLAWAVAFHGGDFRLIALDGRERASLPSTHRRQLGKHRMVALRHLALGGSAAVSSLGPNVPRYALGLWAGPESVAIFTLLVYFPMMAQLVVVSMGQTQVATLGNEFWADRVAFRSRVHMLIGAALGVGAVLLAGGGLMGEAVLAFLYGSEIAGYAGSLALFLMYGAVAFVVAVLHYAIVASGRYKSHLTMAVIAAATLSVMVLAWVPTHGLNGAVMAMLVATTIHAVGAYLVVARA